MRALLTPAYIPDPSDRLHPEILRQFGLYSGVSRRIALCCILWALMALLYNLKLIQPVVQVSCKGFFYKLMGLSGAES
jgi:hypothetical protein